LETDEKKRSLKEIFISTFHDKVDFDYFTNFDMEKEFKTLKLNQRTVYAPSKKLKLIQRFINSSILEFADYNRDVVYSYRKGTAIRDAVEKHSSSHHFFQTDISNFFGSLKSDDVYKAITTRLSNAPITDLEQYIDRLLYIMVVENQLPAGFATSPLLSNICLVDFDDTLKLYCDENNLIYTRYSDDLIISSKNSDFTIYIEDVIQRLLHQEINPDVNISRRKTKIRHRGQKIKILGFSILPNGIVTISSSYKKEVETMLHLYINDDDKFDDYVKNKLKPRPNQLLDKSYQEYGVNSLCGRLISISAMDKNYISKLRQKYGNTIIEMFLRKSVK
jgi:RNA-directed DNA polymerase